MIRTGIYSEVTDLKAVDQIGWIDLGEAVKNGYVPAGIGQDDASFNGIDDPASIMSRADDVFGLYRQADYISHYTTNSESEVPTE